MKWRTGAGTPLGAAAAGASLLLLLSPHVVPELTWVFCLAVGGLTLAWCCRRFDPDPVLARMALMSYALRSGWRSAST